MYQEVLTDEGKKIFPKLRQFKNFYLAGGTALALQIGHRISVDFDLFTNKKIPKTLLPEIEKVFTGSLIKILINSSDELTVTLDGLKLTFLHYPFPVISKTVSLDGLLALSVGELSATKAYTIGRRGTLKDYVDLYFIAKDEYFDLPKIIPLAEKKYGDAFNARLFLEQIIYLQDIEPTAIQFLKSAVSKKTIQNFFEKKVKAIKL